MDGYELHTASDVAEATCRLYLARQRRALSDRGRFLVNLSGGSTPLALYRLLAVREDLDWDRTWVTWGDERYVPPDHDLSNAGAARKALLDRVPIPPGQVLAWPWGPALEPEVAAADHQRQLEAAFEGPPTFDLTLLGLGEDGHTASLFPGTGAVFATGMTAAVRPRGAATARLTMTPRALSNSRVVAFLVRGEGKRSALEATLAGSGDLDRFPARSVSALERLVWITDLVAVRQPDDR